MSSDTYSIIQPAIFEYRGGLDEPLGGKTVGVLLRVSVRIGNLSPEVFNLGVKSR